MELNQRSKTQSELVNRPLYNNNTDDKSPNVSENREVRSAQNLDVYFRPTQRQSALSVINISDRDIFPSSPQSPSPRPYNRVGKPSRSAFRLVCRTAGPLHWYGALFCVYSDRRRLLCRSVRWRQCLRPSPST